MKRLLLNDADVTVHKISRAVENKVRWDKGVWSWYATEQDTDIALENYINKLKSEGNFDVVKFALSHEDNFRNKFYAQYKGDRSNEYEPMMKGYIRDKLVREHGAIIVPGLEADDVLGILQTSKDYFPGFYKVIGTIDKDLRGIPGGYLDLNKTPAEECYITQEQADFFFFQQVLTGDRTDNIPGIQGIGLKTAEKILGKPGKSLEEYWGICRKEYQRAGMTEQHMIVTARLVRILRAEDWDKDSKTPILIKPKYK